MKLGIYGCKLGICGCKLGVCMINIESIKITSTLLGLIAELDEFRGSWQAWQHLAPEQLSILRKVATIESIGSSTRIEGAQLTDKEVEILLSRLDVHSFRSRDEEEVAGYANVMGQIFFSYQAIPLTENYLKQLHAMLLQYSSKDVRHRGEYKKFPNHVEAFDEHGKSLGIVFKTATPFETPLKMQELMLWAQQALIDKMLHPLLVIALFVVCFLAIHPFQDGNGRLSRIITTLLLLKEDYSYVPYSSLENIVEANKENYYLALRRTQITLETSQPNWEPWLIFFLQSLKKQKDNLAAKLKYEKFAVERLNPLAIKIVKLIQEHGQLTISQLYQFTQINRNTLKVQLRQLVTKQYLILHGEGRGTWYTIGNLRLD